MFGEPAKAAQNFDRMEAEKVSRWKQGKELFTAQEGGSQLVRERQASMGQQGQISLTSAVLTAAGKMEALAEMLVAVKRKGSLNSVAYEEMYKA